MDLPSFQPTVFQFLKQLSRNNNRPWFQENKWRYEQQVLEPALAFIREFQPKLKKISSYFVASDRRMGGSLMRIYRDTRFAKDSTPYKTNIGIQFRHELGRDIHAPGFYIHIAPGECLLAVGLWRPDRQPLGQVRQAIDEWPDRWRRTRNGKKFRELFALEGGSLKRAPLGFEPDHRLIEDLKRTDFIAVHYLSEQDVLAAGFSDRVATAFGVSRLFMRFLCDALKVPL